VCEWLGAEIRIEGYKRYTSRVEEDDRHERRRERRLREVAAPENASESADKRGNPGKHQWRSQIGEGSEREVAHVSHGEGGHLGVLHESGGDVSGSGKVPDLRKNHTDDHGGARRDHCDGASSEGGPLPFARDRGTEQERQSWIDGDRVVL